MPNDRNEIREKLKQISLFQGISDSKERLEKIVSKLKEKKVKAGDLIVKEGDIGDEVYIIKQGSVRVLKNTLENDTYTVITLSSNENIFFGELALVDNDTRSASVMAETECDLLVFSRDSFNKLAEEDPYLGFKITHSIAKIIATRLRKANKDIITLFEALVNEVEGKE